MALLTKAELLTHLQLTTTITAVQDAVITQLLPSVDRLVKDFVGYEIERGTHIEYHPETNRFVEEDPLIGAFEGTAQGARAVLYGNEDHRIIYLNQLPLISIQNLYENVSAWDTAGGSWPSSSKLVEGRDYRIDYDLNLDSEDVGLSGAVYRQTTVWPRERRTVRVEYTAGFLAAQLDFDGRYGVFKHAALLASQMNFMEALSNTLNDQSGSPGTGVAAESLDGWSIKYVDAVIAELYSMMYQLPNKVKLMLAPHVRANQFIGV